MNKVFLIQTDIGHPDPWDDAINMANVSIKPGLGNTNNAEGYDNRISFFQRVDNRFAISTSRYEDADLILKKPFTVDNSQAEVKLNFNEIANIVDNTVDGIALYASLLNNESLTNQEVIKSASFYMRIGNDVRNLITNESIHNPRMIPWFFCFRAKDLPLYYIVMNPHAVQTIGQVDGAYGDNEVYTVSNHLKNMNDVIFKPKFSKNARVIGENNVFVRGDEFIIEPFGTWFVKEHLSEFFKDAKVKIDTNFDYTIEDNKIRVNVINKQRGYISLRWNTGTVMDMAFHTSKNRFFKEYIVDVIQ
jgi:hypothetical protein